MNPDILDRVLSCHTLPTLPAVGVRVLELTRDERVSISEIAATIQNDQGLAAKVLRTVNSSFFGLRRPCTSINQAIVMLGLAAVKTLALGFSLVSAIKGEEGDGFDYASYWRRSLFTGIAARVIAKHARVGVGAGGPGGGGSGGVSGGAEEECFLGGLLQDVGMVALHRALGDEYGALLAEAAGDHRRLAKLELSALDMQHPDVGAMLAARWKLPDELVMPIKYHERPSAAPAAHLPRVRAVALGNIAADVLTAAEAAGPLSRFYARAQEWFGLGREAADEVLTGVTSATREVSRLLQVDAGEVGDAQEIVRRAQERLLAITLPADAEGARGGGAAAPADQDAVTGAGSRQSFDRTVITAFEQARAGVTPLSLSLFELTALDEMTRTHGLGAANGALVSAAATLREEFRAAGGLVFRHSGAVLAVVTARADRAAIERAAETARRRIVGTAVGEKRLAVPVSAGLAWVDGATLGKFRDVGELVSFTESALRAAKLAGRNALRVYAPAAAAA